MTDRELMQQALDALELYQSKSSVQMFDDAAKALRERLAQPEQQWQGLTDDEIEEACVPLGAAMLSFTEVARAIEAKIKEKNGYAERKNT